MDPYKKPQNPQKLIYKYAPGNRRPFAIQFDTESFVRPDRPPQPGESYYYYRADVNGYVEEYYLLGNSLTQVGSNVSLFPTPTESEPALLCQVTLTRHSPRRKREHRIEQDLHYGVDCLSDEVEKAITNLYFLMLEKEDGFVPPVELWKTADKAGWVNLGRPLGYCFLYDYAQ
jgi:hypothetical protein